MDNLKKAIIGDPNKLQGNVRSDFGFLGDLGCLPTAAFPAAPALDRLLTQGTYPAWTFSPTPQIGAGWKGPYITGSVGEIFTKDQWGNDYTYTPVAGGCPLTADLTSNGPDGAFSTTDDIILSMISTETTSTVSGFIKDPNGNPVPSSTVTINYAVNGTLTTSTTPTDATGFYSFGPPTTPIPFGKRSISVSPKLIVTSARALTSPNTAAGRAFCGGVANPGAGQPACTYIEFRLVNFTTPAVTGITSLTATFSGGAFYYQINWQTATVFNGATGVGSGTPTTITASSVGAATALQPYVYIVDNSQKQLADIQIGARGEVGTSVLVQIINFRNCAGGISCGGQPLGQLNMAGVDFIITFSDGSQVQFTPQ